MSDDPKWLEVWPWVIQMSEQPKWQSAWPEFEAILKRRLQAGYEHYGDWSFDRPPGQLLEEIEQEALDIIGWGFILWHRINKLKAQVRSSQHGTEEAKS